MKVSRSHTDGLPAVRSSGPPGWTLRLRPQERLLFLDSLEVVPGIDSEHPLACKAENTICVSKKKCLPRAFFNLGKKIVFEIRLCCVDQASPKIIILRTHLSKC